MITISHLNNPTHCCYILKKIPHNFLKILQYKLKMAKIPHDLDLSLNLSLIPQKSHFRLKLLKYPTLRDKSLTVASLVG